MLEEVIIHQIVERENRKNPERRDSGWQPVPLYEEVEMPRNDPQERRPIEIDIWGPQGDSIVDYNVVRKMYS